MNSIEFNNQLYTVSRSLKTPAIQKGKEVNDLIQEVLVGSLENESKFKSGINIKDWFYLFTLPNPFSAKTATVEPALLAVTESTINTTDMYQAISQMDKTYQEPFMLHFSGYKNEEIASQLNIALDVVVARIATAREILKDSL